MFFYLYLVLILYFYYKKNFKKIGYKVFCMVRRIKYGKKQFNMKEDNLYEGKIDVNIYIEIQYYNRNFY